MKNLKEIEYDLEIERVVSEIKNQKAKRVLIQLPDGLKPISTDIVEALNEQVRAEILIWFGSCFGACDIPLAEAEKLGIDLIIQFGHSAWNFD